MQQLYHALKEDKMDSIDWKAWVPGTVSPQMIIDPTCNFESRRTLGVWEYRLGTVRQPIVDQLYLYGQKNDEWNFSESQNPADTHVIIIETADGKCTGKIQIGTV